MISRLKISIVVALTVLIVLPAVLLAEDVSLDTVTEWVEEIVAHQKGQDARLDAMEKRLNVLEEKLPTPTTVGHDAVPAENAQKAPLGTAPVENSEDGCQLALRNRVDFQSLEAYMEKWPGSIVPNRFEIISVSSLSEQVIGILSRVKAYSSDAIYQSEPWFQKYNRYFLEMWTGCELVDVQIVELPKLEYPSVQGDCLLSAQDRIQLSSIGLYMERWPGSSLTGDADIVSVWHVLGKGVSVVFEPLWNRDGGNTAWGNRFLRESWDGCEFAGSVWGEDEISVLDFSAALFISPSTSLGKSEPETTSDEQALSVNAAALFLLASDYRNDAVTLQNMSESQHEELVAAYIVFLEYVANYCALSYEDMALLVNDYAIPLDSAGFTAEDGTKPRAFLLAFTYGFTIDSESGTYPCETPLSWGQAAGLTS